MLKNTHHLFERQFTEIQRVHMFKRESEQRPITTVQLREYLKREKPRQLTLF